MTLLPKCFNRSPNIIQSLTIHSLSIQSLRRYGYPPVIQKSVFRPSCCTSRLNSFVVFLKTTHSRSSAERKTLSLAKMVGFAANNGSFAVFRMHFRTKYVGRHPTSSLLFLDLLLYPFTIHKLFHYNHIPNKEEKIKEWLITVSNFRKKSTLSQTTQFLTF